jgi:hypothetical protein
MAEEPSEKEERLQKGDFLVCDRMTTVDNC